MTVDFLLFFCRTRRLGWLIIFVIAGLGGLTSRVLASQSVELTWAGSSSPNVVSYTVYYGTQSQQYTASVAYGDISDVVVSGLADGQTYYFAATATDVNGNESAPSSEVVYTTPGETSIMLQVQGTTAASQGVDV